VGGTKEYDGQLLTALCRGVAGCGKLMSVSDAVDS